MRRSNLVVLLGVLALVGCARSQHDRELDRIFAHQARLRDTTGAVAGTVLDAATGQPLGGIFVSTQFLGDLSDSAGRFVISYLSPGPQTVTGYERGYEPATVTIPVAARETTEVTLRLRRAPAPCCDLEGRWHIALTLDSAGLEQTPSARQAEGKLTFSRQFPDPFGASVPLHDPWVHTTYGQFDIDFAPFWGTQVAADVSTTVFGPMGPSFTKEASGAVFYGDSATVDLIPRISHGGVSLAGRLVHPDTLEGGWVQRAYCCGATGHFQMVRTARDPGPIVIPPPIRPIQPDTLAEVARGDVRVRVWDEAQGAYIRATHALEQPDGSTKSAYTTGTQPDGWGQSFWLAPGRYAVLLSRYPCGTEAYFLAHEIKRPFVARAGERTDITIRIDTRKLKPARSYNNPSGLRCSTNRENADDSGA